MERLKVLAVVQADLQLICKMRDALDRSGLASLSIARNSQEAILYLRGVGVYADRRRHPFPDVVLLDCENPNGADLDVLSWMRENADLRETPVIMLSPEEHRHLHVSCMLDSVCFIVDRHSLDEITDAIANLQAARIYAAGAPDKAFSVFSERLSSWPWI